MALEKAEIVKLKNGNPTSDKLECMFNPETLSFNRSACWDGKPIPQESTAARHYKGGGKSTLTIDLLLDVSLEKSRVGVIFGKVKFLYSLMEVEDTTIEGKKYQQPPYCRFIWGGHEYVSKGFVRSVDVTYKLFEGDGTPIRATAKVTFTVMEEKVTGQNPTTRSEARKTWVVREGERLDWIAYQEYGDASQWRHIAETNGIENPFELQSGRVLKLVPLP